MRARYIIAVCFSAACSTLIGIEDPEAIPVDAAVCKVSPCDLAPQCGCGSAGACDVNDTGTHVCRNAGSGTESTKCTQDTDCARGYTCAYHYGMGHCQKWCAMDSECGTRGSCIDQLSSSSGLIPGAITCSSDCDPLSPSAACPSNWSCAYYTFNSMGTSRDILECRPAGTVAAGGSCASSPAACESQLTCVNFSNGTSICEHMCSPTMNPFCSTGTCHSFSTKFIVAGVEYGSCF